MDPSDSASPLPASATKHLTTLHHPLPTREAVLSLQQRAAESDSGGAAASNGKGTETTGTGTTGTTLWIGGQVLAAYLASLKPPTTTRTAAAGSSSSSSSASTGPTSSSTLPLPRNPAALELGAGIGFLSLSLAAQGYDVISTDIEPIVSTVLRPNAAAAARVLPAGSGKVVVRELDWVAVSAGGELRLDLDDNAEQGTRTQLPPALDLLATADTVYAPELVPHFWATITRICRECEQSGKGERNSPGRDSANDGDGDDDATAGRAPKFFFAIERRDPRMLDAALEQGRQAGMELRRVAHGRVARAVERAYGWKNEGWEGVEVWKGRWRGLGGEQRES